MTTQCGHCGECALTCASQSAVQAVRLHEKDNTATLLTSLPAPASVRVGCVWNGTVEVVPLLEAVEFGHKMAVRPIKASEAVLKYGEIIGTAVKDIAVGAHVHVHNVASNRGRGDKAVGNGKSARTTRSKARILHQECVLRQPLIDLSQATFQGYLREDGRAGTRNVVGILSCVACANDVVMRLADKKSAAFTHQQGCSQTKPDVDRITEVLYNLAANPNLGAVLLVSLGCESVPSETLFERIRALGKPCELLVVQKEGGMKAAVKRGRKALRVLQKKIKDCERTELPISLLRVGLKCGSSDTTQGLSANVVCGCLTDALVAAGATVVMGETTEFMGAEHIAAAHASDTDVARQIVGRVLAMEKRAMSVGVDMRGGQPTRGNIAGGLTTIEEKSLGALAKAGSAVFREVTD
ncbi:MAG: UxaA family hydrolase, partial [Duodenibacillus sp.]